MTPAELLVDSLAAHRLTRLVTADVITQPLRDRALAWAWRRRRTEVVAAARDRGDVGLGVLDDLSLPFDALPEGSIQGAMEDGLLDDPPKLATLITCRWCAGFYVAAVVVGLSAARTPGWRVLSRVLAASSAAALWASLEDR